ncbi:MAG: tetratricopeptide repeat protein, partial [Candidatus Latescibacterota bacterium]
QESRFRAFEGQTRILIGQLYQAAGDRERALAEYNQVRDDFPQTAASAMALYRTGLLYLQGFGQLDRAREYLQEVGQEKPGSEAVQLAQEMLRHLTRIKQLDERIAKVAVPTDPVVVSPDSTSAAEGVILESTDSVAAPPPPPPPPAGGEGNTGSGAREGRREPTLEEDLLEAAELFRDPARLAVPDSALRYYEEVLRRFPASEQVPRVLYSIGWVHGQRRGDPEQAEPYLQRLLTEFPGTEHARAARELLGLESIETAEAAAARAFRIIEERRLLDPANAAWLVPALDTLVAAYPRTNTAAKAAFLAATTFEDQLGDTLEAEVRFQRLARTWPTTVHGRLAEERDRARSAGLLAKLQRSLKGVGGQTAPGERIRLIAVEPDSLDSTLLARKELGFALRAHQRGDLKLAREFYERSLEQRQGQPEALYRLGQVVQEQGFREDAQEYYRRALALGPGLVTAYYRLFSTFVAEGKADSASHYLRQIVNRDSRNPQIARLLEEHPELGDQGKEVELDLEVLESLELEPSDDPLVLSFADAIAEPPLVREVAHPRSLPEVVVGDSTEVLLDLLVGPGGHVEQAQVYRGEEALRESALEAGRRYAFYPALDRSDREVRVWVELAVPFAGSRPRSDSSPSEAPPTEAAPPVRSPEIESGSTP